jgi:hypothetical protein
MFQDGRPGNANLPIGAVQPANREIGVPEIDGLRDKSVNPSSRRNAL